MQKTSNIAKLPRYKWVIKNENFAKRANLQLVDIDESNTLLKVNLQNIPKDMSVADFIDVIQKHGIVVLDRK